MLFYIADPDLHQCPAFPRSWLFKWSLQNLFGKRKCQRLPCSFTLVGWDTATQECCSTPPVLPERAIHFTIWVMERDNFLSKNRAGNSTALSLSWNDTIATVVHCTCICSRKLLSLLISWYCSQVKVAGGFLILRFRFL